MASAPGREGRPVHGGKVTNWLSKVFELNPAGLNWPRAVMVLDVALVPLVVFWAIGHEEYLLSAVFGLLFAVLADPGGGYAYRVSHIAVFALIGAGLTALGFGIGGDAWGWLVLAAFAVTLAAGLAAMFGVHRFVAAYLLNIWFIIVLGLVAMKASLDQTTIVAVQRLAGALTGALAAGLLLLIPASEHGLRLFAVDRGLEVVALVILVNGVAIRFWNYALYCGAIAAGVLILVDLPQPSDYAAEGYRVLWTLCGVGIGVLVMFLAGLLARRTAKTPQPATQPA